MNSLMNTFEDLPCRGCICWASCRLKGYFKAMDECKILVNYMTEHETPEKTLERYYFHVYR